MSNPFHPQPALVRREIVAPVTAEQEVAVQTLKDQLGLIGDAALIKRALAELWERTMGELDLST